MIKVEKLSYGFPEKDLYKEVSFTIEDGQHCVLIGSNGSGKTTLVDMLMRTEDYLYEGKIRKELSGRIGYVSQFVAHDKDLKTTVYDFLAQEFIQKQDAMEEICRQMETAENVEEIYEQYQNAVDEFDAMDGYNYDTNIHQQLKLAGLTKVTDLSLDAISGGEFKLIQIIRQMMRRPGLLIMDEPDVFLDFENLAGLHNLINSYKGTILCITHNRYLLNHCFDKILHLENMDIQEFEGTYIDYNLALLQMKVELQEKAHNDELEIARQQALVDKLRADATRIANASKGAALKARVSYLGRLEARRIKAPFVEVREPKIQLPVVYKPAEPVLQADDNEPVYVSETLPETILSVDDYSVAFDDVLLENVSFSMGPHDKVAIVGSNGTGKTTMLRDIYFGRTEAARFDDSAVKGFLSQIYGEMLNEDQTILEMFEGLGFELRREVAAYLADYYFDDESLDKKIGVLSGGEKNLLQLAMISLGQANVLLLDEPTSHLDTWSQIALEKAIAAYNGAVLMVSHDFYTIADCVDYVLFVENKTLRKMSCRAFRKMIYKNHFSKDYLEVEQQKKQLEVKVAALLKSGNFEKAREVCEELEQTVDRLKMIK